MLCSPLPRREEAGDGPWMVNVPSGPEKSVCNGIVQVVVAAIGAAFDDVSVSGIGLPPVGVNMNVMLNAVGMKTDVLPPTSAGVNSPFPFTTTGIVWPSQMAVIWVAFFALPGSAAATGTMTAAANARHAAAVNRRRFMCSPLPQWVMPAPQGFYSAARSPVGQDQARDDKRGLTRSTMRVKGTCADSRPHGYVLLGRLGH